jgi:hypothetical protein
LGEPSDKLVIHNSPPYGVTTYDFNGSHTYATMKQFIDANIRNDHKKTKVFR